MATAVGDEPFVEDLYDASAIRRSAVRPILATAGVIAVVVLSLGGLYQGYRLTFRDYGPAPSYVAPTAAQPPPAAAPEAQVADTDPQPRAAKPKQLADNDNVPPADPAQPAAAAPAAAPLIQPPPIAPAPVAVQPAPVADDGSPDERDQPPQ